MQYTWSDIEGLCLDISRQITNDNWKPDYIVGIMPTGAVPALLISHYLNTRLESTHVNESNSWMSEDAFDGKNILVIDSLTNDDTFDYIKYDWVDSCNPNNEDWGSIFGSNVKFATLVHDTALTNTVQYYATEINAIDENINVKFPWENFWRNS